MLGYLEWFALIAVFVISGLPALFAGKVLDVRGRRHLAPILYSPENFPDRSFVLYLRSFKDDAARERLEYYRQMLKQGLFTELIVNLRLSPLTQEEQLIAALKPAGPVVAVGQPGEQLPELGALRVYRSNDTWQDAVLGLLRDARLVVIALGSGRGLEWELIQAVRLAAPERLVLLVLMTREEYGALRKSVRRSFELEVRRLRSLGSRWYPPVLPAYPRKLSESAGWIIQFDRTWSPKCLILPGLDAGDVAHPGWSSIDRQFQESMTRALHPVLQYLAHADGLDIPSRASSRIFPRSASSLVLIAGPLTAALAGAYAGVIYAVGITAGIVISGIVGILIGAIPRRGL